MSGGLKKRAVSADCQSTLTMRQPRPAIRRPLSEPGFLRALGAAEDGVSLIEVVISALLIGMIVIAMLSGFDQTQRASVEEQRHAQADALAQQDQDRMRGMSVAALLGPGLSPPPVTLDRAKYTIVSSAQFVSDTGGTPSCSSTGTSNADYVKTTSSVSWASMGVRKPVVEESLIAPPAGGSLVVQVQDPLGNPVPNMSVTATGTAGGTTPSVSATTSAAGCAIFGGLGVGPYTVGATQAGPPPWVDKDWNAAPTQSASVTGSSTAKLPFVMAQAGGVSATFATNVPGVGQLASQQDRFVAFNPGMTSQSGVTVGTAGQYRSTVTSALQVFPTSYTVYAGSCTADQPGSTENPQSITVTPGQISTPPAPLKAPAVLVHVYSGSSSSSPGSPINQPLQDVTVTDACNVKRRYSGAALTAPTSSTGALVDPGEPYGRLTVCGDANIGGQLYNTSNTVSNSTFSTGTPTPLYEGVASQGSCP